MMRIIFFIPIVILSLANAFSQQLTERFLVAHYDNQSGLPQNSVKDIVKDTDGFIWLSTEDGLVRYDGRSFKVYNKNHFQINSTRFRIRKDYFQNHVYIATTSLEEVLPIHHGNVYHSNETDNTAQWIDGTSYIFGNLDLAWSSGIPTKIQHLSDVPNRALQAGNGFFYVCSSHKISMYKYLQKQWEINFQSSDKNMFFILHHQLYYYTPTEGGWVFSKQGPTKCKTLPHKNGISPQLYWNEDEDQAFFSYNDEIYFVQNWNQNTLTWTQISDDVQLTKNRIHCMFYDTTNHILLLGSSTNGLFAVKTKNFRNISSGVLNDPNIYYSLVPYNDSTIATPDGYLISLTGKPTLVKPTPINQQLGDAKYIMVTDKNNNFWLKDGRSLLALNHDLKLLHKYTVSQPIHYIFYNNTRLWLGFTRGIAYMDISDFSTTSSPVFIPSSSFLKNVSLITQDHTGSLWIGSYNGIYKIHPKQLTVTYIKGSHEKHWRSALVDSSNTLWFTSYEDGFFRVNQDSLIKMPIDKNGYLSAAHCILADAHGYFWISTNNGIFRMLRQDLMRVSSPNEQVYYEYYTSADGLLNNEMNGGCNPCGGILSSGIGVFPSMSGIAVFNTHLKTGTYFPQSIVLEEVEMDGKPLQWKDTIMLPTAFKRINLFFASAFFGNDNALQSQYRLINTDKDTNWYHYNSSVPISFTSLPAGTTLMELKVLSGYNGAYIYKKIYIYRAYKITETWWFYILTPTLIILIFILIMILRTFSLRRNNLRLKNLVDKQTQALVQENEKIARINVEVERKNKLNQRLISAVSHDIRAPLKYLDIVSARLAEKGNTDSSTRQTMQSINDSIKSILLYSNNIVDYAKANMSDGSGKSVNMHDLVEHKMALFKNMSHHAGKEIQNRIHPDKVFKDCSEIMLNVVIHNLLDNSIRHGKSDIISIEAFEDNSLYILCITEENTEFDNALIKKLNQLLVSEPSHSHSGLGLILVNDLIHIHRGSIKIEWDKGLKFKIELKKFNPPDRG